METWFGSLKYVIEIETWDKHRAQQKDVFNCCKRLWNFGSGIDLDLLQWWDMEQGKH